MAGNRNYSNTATPVGLTAAATTSSTTLEVSSTTGYPEPPFLLGLERGTSNEEVVLVTAATSTTFTVARGYDGSTARTHATGTTVEHTVAAIDYREPAEHINASTGVHGLAAGSAVVGTNDAQVLKNKTLDFAEGGNVAVSLPASAIPPLDASKIVSGTFAPSIVPPSTWAALTGKPATFAPIIGTSATTAKAGNYVPTWGEITGKPTTSTLDGRTIYVSDNAPVNSQGVNGDIWLEY